MRLVDIYTDETVQINTPFGRYTARLARRLIYDMLKRAELHFSVHLRIAETFNLFRSFSTLLLNFKSSELEA